MKTRIIIARLVIYPALLFLLLPVFSQENRMSLPYLDSKLTVENRVKDLLARMTVEEKVAQLQCESRGIDEKLLKTGIGGLATTLRSLGPLDAAERANQIQKTAVEGTRLGIPIIIHDEALHGLVGKEATSFPQAIGLAAMWDPDLLQQVAAVIGRQTRSRGIRQVLSPVINVARDVRWGRVEETYGEDPYLTSRMGVAFCKAIEAAGVITTPKHFAANVGDGGRDSNAIHFSERLLREIYFPAFKACFQEGHATSVMAAYNSIDGVPCSANHWLLTEMLRGEWGFEGFVVSDYGSVGGVYTLHHTAATEKETAKQTLEAGLDVEFPRVSYYGKPLLDAVKEGLISQSALDTAVGRVLRAKMKLGLFENPYVDPAQAAKLNDTSDDRALARRAARESIVLLKNANGVLPLKKDLRSIAVIGPGADAVRLGGYSGSGMKVVTVLEGIKNKVWPATKVNYAKGCEFAMTELPWIASEYLVPPDAAPGAHGLRAEYFNNMDLSGQPALVRIDRQLHFDWGPGSPDPRIQPDHFSARWTGKLVPPFGGLRRLSVTTDDGVRFYIDGKLVVDSWHDRGVTSDSVTMNLEAGRPYDIRIEYYEDTGDAFASLGWSLASSVDPQITDAVSVAKQSDAAVIVTGIFEGESHDRGDLNLSSGQETLIKSVAATGVPTVVIIAGGSAVTMNNWIEEVPAIVESWYSGEEGGNAIADVIFGDSNPGGRLPITFPQSVGQVPLYYNPDPSGRGYDYTTMSGRPLFPFGYGLSYTKFEYTNLRISPANPAAMDTVQIRFDLKNVDDRKGDEVVQLYLHGASEIVARPLKELKGFKRVSLSPNETATVTFNLTPELLSSLDLKLKPVVVPGVYDVMIGSSSEDIRLKGNFEIKGGK
jgi:beta-glucosidase